MKKSVFKFLCILSLLFIVKSNLTIDESKNEYDNFVDYMNYFNYDYLSISVKEVARRFFIFANNLKVIKEHNSKPDRFYDLGLTQFTDKSLEELSQKLLIKNILDFIKNNKRNTKIVNSNETEFLEKLTFLSEKAYDNIDWRQKDIFLPPRDQGQCGSCWAFASVGTIEALRSIKFNKKEYLSVQQLLDCDTQDKACKGGWPSIAYSYISKNGGLVSEAKYPYKGNKDTCNSKVIENVSTSIDKSINECEEDECLKNDFQYNLLKNGPIAVSIDAYNTKFFNYVSGYYDEECGEPNHAVMLVGYGYDKENDVKYWIIRNSWGESWGMKGYGYVKYNVNNMKSCNLNRYGYQPIVLK
jgi:KDEL-tailed cysteine endopeptidase